MGRLNFSLILEVTSGVDMISIINTPDDSLLQCYVDSSKNLQCKRAKVDYNKDYENTKWGEEESLGYSNMRTMSVRSFPQYGSYAAISYKDEDGLHAAKIITDF